MKCIVLLSFLALASASPIILRGGQYHEDNIFIQVPNGLQIIFSRPAESNFFYVTVLNKHTILEQRKFEEKSIDKSASQFENWKHILKKYPGVVTTENYEHIISKLDEHIPKDQDNLPVFNLFKKALNYSVSSLSGVDHRYMNMEYGTPYVGNTYYPEMSDMSGTNYNPYMMKSYPMWRNVKMSNMEGMDHHMGMPSLGMSNMYHMGMMYPDNMAMSKMEMMNHGNMGMPNMGVLKHATLGKSNMGMMEHENMGMHNMHNSAGTMEHKM